MDAARMLTGVTISGADDRVVYGDMVAISLAFPFVEWGILLSNTRQGTPRYPSDGWILNLPPGLRLSMHCCGEVARNVLAGTHSPWHNVRPKWTRRQFNGYTPPASEDFLDLAALWRGGIILQVRNPAHLPAAHQDIRCIDGGSVLYDPSGGRGLFVGTPPLAPEGLVMGYAGGINQHNVLDLIGRFNRRGREYWLDMETGVRTEDDRLDFSAVEAVLQACVPHVRS